MIFGLFQKRVDDSPPACECEIEYLTATTYFQPHTGVPRTSLTSWCPKCGSGDETTWRGFWTVEQANASESAIRTFLAAPPSAGAAEKGEGGAS